jgi:hypothetical protein
MKNRNARHAAQENRLKKCLLLDFQQDINSNHHQQAAALPAQIAVHPIVQAVRKRIAQVTIY